MLLCWYVFQSVSLFTLCCFTLLTEVVEQTRETCSNQICDHASFLTDFSRAVHSLHVFSRAFHRPHFIPALFTDCVFFPRLLPVTCFLPFPSLTCFTNLRFWLVDRTFTRYWLAQCDSRWKTAENWLENLHNLPSDCVLSILKEIQRNELVVWKERWKYLVV